MPGRWGDDLAERLAQRKSRAIVRCVRVGVAGAVGVIAIVAATAAGAWSDPRPPTVMAPTTLSPLPRQALNQCRLATRLGICPTRLPRAFIGLRGPPPQLVAERFKQLNGRTLLVGMSFSYGAPWEPDSGAGWQDHVWRNRPCCFLHFELWKSLRGRPGFPEKSRRAVIGGRHGDLAPSSGFGMACGPGNAGVFFCNHTRFRWRAGKTWYVASLHRFGAERETQVLLGKILSTLRPVRP